jgi:hypothetical protein
MRATVQTFRPSRMYRCCSGTGRVQRGLLDRHRFDSLTGISDATQEPDLQVEFAVRPGDNTRFASEIEHLTPSSWRTQATSGQWSATGLSWRMRDLVKSAQALTSIALVGAVHGRRLPWHYCLKGGS